MFDTHVTIVGNVLTAPEWRRTTQSNTLVANFKVASTARRLDRDSGRWVDGNSLRVRVNCWRKLAEGVAASVMLGDPVVVCGRLYTRDWTDDAGNHRTLYELEAVAVGHDLSRGRGRFLRNRPTLSTSVVSDAEAEQRVHGEATESVPDDEAPARFDDQPIDDDFELAAAMPSRVDAARRSPARDGIFPDDPFDDLISRGQARADELAPVDAESRRTFSDELAAIDAEDQQDASADELAAVGADIRAVSPDEPASVDSETSVTGGGSAGRPEESGTGVVGTGRGRRGRGRQPQPV
ncbi:hypothetical protein GCM10011608_36300 [Micromonospora sonchi]|uniref:Single-stranded DNA-binding protein n=1 Tax=Micromonospora sonchi TaxID=1763543 RepID=A0A917U0B3_9ACTN|nr:single-stranded DNA-binding protein [Micromonospora sonchi]GGM48221.1 hypothetical protein GCM10011608_36300 [Micromonospora sonchi]